MLIDDRRWQLNDNLTFLNKFAYKIYVRRTKYMVMCDVSEFLPASKGVCKDSRTTSEAFHSFTTMYVVVQAINQLHLRSNLGL